MSSVGSEAGSEGSHANRNAEVVKKGYLKKFKTMKKKFFVLRSNSVTSPACLEYYDSCKKWKNNQPPKRSIAFKRCYSINRRTDTKHKYVVALFSGADCFGMVFENEDEMQEWLRLLLLLKLGESLDGIAPKPYYDHVWRVTVQKKELALKHSLNGVYLLCLTGTTLSLVKHNVNDDQETKCYEFALSCIRRCGNLDSFFYMELGQASCLGPGNLWMQVEDSYVSLHMHSVIMHACTSVPKKDLLPKSRSRSSSANEASKPIYCGRKWPSSGDDSISYPKTVSQQDHNVTSPCSMGYDSGRERCDSLPTRPSLTNVVRSGGNPLPYLSSTGSGRPHSMYTRSIFSPNGCSHPTSPMSATYSTDSAGSSLSVDADSENWSEVDSIRKIILEENSEDYVQWGGNQNRNFLAENIPHGVTNKNTRSSICPNSSSNSQSSCSPCSSSPMDAGTYIPMSPESAAENKTRILLNRSFDSVNHSRESSIHEDVAEGYVPMAPLSVDAGYMSMDHSGRKRGDLSSGLSSCSITSGTPSTDVRFSQGHLDKVSSYLTPSDDDIIFNMRPTRAYSTGSKPDTLHNKFVRCDSADGLRVRAFSVGSRRTTIMPPTPRRTPVSTSASSIEPCEDLMEMDFSANRHRNRQVRSRGGSVRTPISGVVQTSAEKLTVPHDMLPYSYSLHDGYMDMSPKSYPKPLDTSDLNMSPPRLGGKLIGRSPPTNIAGYVKQTFSKGSPVSTTNMLEKVLETECRRSEDDDNSYMDMKPGVCDVVDGPMAKMTPIITTAMNLHVVHKDTFTIVDPAAMKSSSSLPHIKQPLLDTDGKQLKPNVVESKSEKNSANAATAAAAVAAAAATSSTTATTTVASTHDGYVDMTFKCRKTADAVANRPVAKTCDGYVDMTFSKGSRKNLVDSNSGETKSESGKLLAAYSGKENQSSDARQCSKPIAIQQGKSKRPGSGFFRRKQQSMDETTLKPNFLPLGISIPTTFASLGRKKRTPKKEKAAETPPGKGGEIFPLSPDRVPCVGGRDNVRPYTGFELRSKSDSSHDEERTEESDYITMTSGVLAVGTNLQRKTSEPNFRENSVKKSNSGKEYEATKKDANALHRSTSVPSTMSGMRSWRRIASFHEYGKGRPNDTRHGRSDPTINEVDGQRMEVDAEEGAPPASTVGEKKQIDNDVPIVASNSTSCCVRSTEKVTYATLDIPALAEQSSACKNESSSSSKLEVQSNNLTYAQIDFEKASSSSSLPSK